MKDVIRKADVLIEALPYIKAFHGKVVVVKYGGSALDNEQIRLGVLEDLTFMSYVGMRPVLVHGGGPEISKRMRGAGKKVEFVNGIRVTDAETVRMVDEAMAELNQQLVRELRQVGAQAEGISGKQEGLITVRKFAGSQDLGFVGEIVSIHDAVLRRLFERQIIPVVSPLGVDGTGQIYNVNADQSACALAGALRAEKFVLLTNVQGILRDPADSGSLISTLTETEVEDLLRRKVIQEGMIPKVRAAIDALNVGVRKAHILDAKLPHGLLLEIFTVSGIGTEIVRGEAASRASESPKGRERGASATTGRGASAKRSGAGKTSHA